MSILFALALVPFAYLGVLILLNLAGVTLSVLVWPVTSMWRFLSTPRSRVAQQVYDEAHTVKSGNIGKLLLWAFGIGLAYTLFNALFQSIA